MIQFAYLLLSLSQITIEPSLSAVHKFISATCTYHGYSRPMDTIVSIAVVHIDCVKYKYERYNV